MCPYRCAINSTPEKVSDAAAHLEGFIKDVAKNRKERKPVRPNIIEVKLNRENKICVNELIHCYNQSNFYLFFLIFVFIAEADKPSG